VGEVVLQESASGHWLYFHSPRATVETRDPGEVIEKLHLVESAVQEGLYAAGFLAYEAASALDPALLVKTDPSFPLLWFGLYDPPRWLEEIPAGSVNPVIQEWQPGITLGKYLDSISRIKEHIRRGDTYQVNYTYRWHTPFRGDLLPFFLQLWHAHEPSYGALLSTKEWIVASVSPELFLDLRGNILLSCPMKGTAPRGRTLEEDRSFREALFSSEKNRAENIMIVDMVRSDMGRISNPGAVTVEQMFRTEKYPAMWQMTTTVRATTQASPVEILKAMFPPASITGAPKPRTMEIIRELESSPRRVYTGAIGFLAPGRRAQFNVAIRTVLMNRETGQAEYGVGSGIVWDSQGEAEWEECKTKARILAEIPSRFDLLETMRWTPGEGIFLLEYHLERLGKSARYFGFSVNLDELRRALRALTPSLVASDHKIRLLVDKKGTPTLEAIPYHGEKKGQPGLLPIASHPMDSANLFLYHKTTHRRLYEDALASCPGYDDVLLFNEKREITESTIANVVVEIGGTLWTPPVECGLLPGTYRRSLLNQGELKEKPISMEETFHSPHVYLINSVRGMYEVTVVNPVDRPEQGSPSMN
jgi:para-aminobenzoate synthetase/4-amino-4-deoxychorismate lyase